MSASLPNWAFAGLSDTGLQRSTNQDSYYLSPAGNLFIVADGMGGHAGGQEASRLTTEVVERYLHEHWQSNLPSSALLEAAVLAANNAVLQQQQCSEMVDMGTTVVILLYRDHQFWCAHVGDSRLYILRENRCIQVTQDHTWVNRAVARGELLPDQAQTHPQRHVLSKCVGRDDLRRVETQRLDIRSGIAYCSVAMA